MPNEKEQGYEAEGTKCKRCKGTRRIFRHAWGHCRTAGHYEDCYLCSPKKGEKWEQELNELLWRNLDIKEWPERGVKAKLGPELEDFIHRIEAQAEQRGRLSGIKEMASRGREAMTNEVKPYYHESVSPVTRVPIEKMLAAHDQALKDLSQ